MALRINDYKTIYGTKATHWIIDNVNINNKYSYAEITLFGYYEEQTYGNRATPLETKTVKINWNDDFEKLFSKKAKYNTNIFNNAYEYVKNNVEMFKNAEDC